MGERLAKQITMSGNHLQRTERNEGYTYISNLGGRRTKLDIFVALLSTRTLFPNPITSMATQLHFKVAKPLAATSNSAQLLKPKDQMNGRSTFQKNSGKKKKNRRVSSAWECLFKNTF